MYKIVDIISCLILRMQNRRIGYEPIWYLLKSDRYDLFSNYLYCHRKETLFNSNNFRYLDFHQCSDKRCLFDIDCISE